MRTGIALAKRQWARHGAEVTALIIALTAVPLAAGWVPINSLYGFRTPASMSSPEQWYRANLLLGLYLLACQAVALVTKQPVTRRLRRLWQRGPADWGVPWVCAVSVAGILASAAHYYLLG